MKAGTLKYRRCNLCIQVIVLCQKDIPSFRDRTACYGSLSMFFYIIAFIRYPVFQCYSKGSTLSKLTLHMYCPAKQIHIFLYDRHSQSGSCDFTLCGVLFTGKCIENLRQIILAHTDSGIAHPGTYHHVPGLITC